MLSPFKNKAGYSCNLMYRLTDVTSFLIVFQSYRDDRMVIRKDCVNGTPFAFRRSSASSGPRTRDRKISKPALSLLKVESKWKVIKLR